jgi:hypothetical protein
MRSDTREIIVPSRTSLINEPNDICVIPDNLRFDKKKRLNLPRLVY